MKAVRIRAFGGPEQVKLEDIPIPEIKAGEALVKIKAAAVNPVDWMTREKIYNPEGMDQVPMTLGQDFSGVIEKIAPGSRSPLHEGDAVFGETFGSFAEYAAIPVKDLVPKPRSFDWITAASIPMPALTAWQMIIDTAKAAPGMKFLIHGASGGVGSFAAQFAKWKGAEVIATASRPSFDYLRSIGVDDIVDYKKERFEATCKDMDVVIDPMGGEVQGRSWGVLRPGGLLINLIGEVDEIAAKKYKVRAVAFDMKYDVKDLTEIADLVNRGLVKPHIAQVLSLDEARRALEMNQRGQSHGKIVLKVS
jgi:NADPH:quinone reductase-like Zn-dependent oxidoreductase